MNCGDAESASHQSTEGGRVIDSKSSVDDIQQQLDKIIQTKLKPDGVEANNQLKIQFDEMKDELNNTLAAPIKELPRGAGWLVGRQHPHHFAYGRAVCWNLVCSDAFVQMYKCDAGLRQCNKQFALLG